MFGLEDLYLLGFLSALFTKVIPFLFGSAKAAATTAAVATTAASAYTAYKAGRQQAPSIKMPKATTPIRTGAEIATVRPRSQAVNSRRGKARSLLSSDNSNGLLS